ncbi:DUF4012 domain-containing protein [Bifidobacterium callimiconis]|uniref:Chemotaxis protein n=1 Tax=Bifidobacterium callimiconis TaxID=2306973 RepID=A0A430FBR5_9BIFI|nr:DUF4012 domain-containing protein [Bifidobacterium callimiconis]RSX50238.1 chemotaxis protein [Bifidobacterium callimiconis]
MKLYSDAKKVQAHEQQALSTVSAVVNLANSSDSSAGGSGVASADLQQQLDAAKQETTAANDITHGALWNITSHIPVIGDDVTTVQGMTSVTNELVGDSLPKFVDVLTSLQNSQLSTDDGRFNLQPILDKRTDIAAADKALQKQVRVYRNLPGGHVGIVNDAYEASGRQLTSLADTVDRMSNAFQMLPDFLGSDQPRTYALMAMTTSEARSSGGLVGSVGVVTTDNGSISIGDFHSDADYLAYGTSTPTDDERRIFQEWGPLQMSFDIRDLAVYPDASRNAESMREIWQRTPWGADTNLDGVIMVDPVLLQELIGITGNVTLSDGTVLTGDNTAEFLLNTVYTKYPQEQQDAFFAQVAEQAVGSMFSKMTTGKLVKVSQIMGDMAQNRHFSLYSFDENAEKTIADAGFTASTPDSEEHPQVGVYVTQQNSSKMDWYIHRTSAVTLASKNGDGSSTYHVTYTLTNTLDSNAAASLPDYIIGISQAGQPKTYGIEKMLFYAPAGGSMTEPTASTDSTGTVTDARQETLNGTKIYANVASLAPGQTVTYEFDVTTSAKAVSDLTVDQTPLGWVEKSE